jgi:hypothetical protein
MNTRGQSRRPARERLAGFSRSIAVFAGNT